MNTDCFVWKYFTTRIRKHYAEMRFFISNHFLVTALGGLSEKSVYDLFAVHGKSCQRANLLL